MKLRGVIGDVDLDGEMQRVERRPRKAARAAGGTEKQRDSAAFRRGYIYGYMAAAGVAGRGFNAGLPPVVVMGGINRHKRDIEAWEARSHDKNPPPRFDWDEAAPHAPGAVVQAVARAATGGHTENE